MYQATQRITRQQTPKTYSRPAPIGGWNARDSLADMPNGDAVKLINMIPRSTSVDLRDGMIQWATGFATTVDTVMGYNPPSGTKQLFAASGASIFDATTQGAIGAPVVAGLTSAKWQFTNIATPGGNYLIAVNGSDSALLYDGAAWQAVTAVSAPISIAGVVTSTLIHVCVFKTRLFFVQKDTMLAWYLPVQSVGGVAVSFDFRSLFRKGGFLMAMDVWTIDGGYGMDDYAAWVTSEGEVAIYRGTDPSAASTWSLVGIYQGGVPMGRRCFMKFGGDLVLISRDGLVSISSLLMSTRVNPKTNLTYKIQSATTDATFNLPTAFGWQAQLFPNQNLVILNVPFGLNFQQQYVMNTINGSWAQFMGWNANCWERFGEDMYFGSGQSTGNFVGKAMTGASDNGSVIIGTTVEAFTYFGPRSLIKSFQMARPVFIANGNFGLNMNMITDYDIDSVVVSAPSYAGTSASVWDSALWDNGVWSGGNIVFKDWEYVNGYGYAGALKMLVSSNTSSVSWVSTDYLYSIGGVL